MSDKWSSLSTRYAILFGLGFLRFFISWLQQRSRNLVIPPDRLFDAENTIEAVLGCQAFVNFEPGAGLVLTDLTVTVVGAAARSVVKALGAHGDRADAARHSQNAFTAGSAALLVPSHRQVGRHTGGIDCRVDGDTGKAFR